MGFGYEFLKDDTLAFANTEQMINFIIDNYTQLMSTYRVMRAQEDYTRDKKEAAHTMLNMVRDMESKLDPQKLSSKQKLELSEKKKHFAKLRTENDVHCYCGEELERDQLTLLILRHPNIMMILEKFDRMGREALAKLSHKALSFIIKPFVTSTNFVKNDTTNRKVEMVAEHMENFYNDLPGIFHDSFMESMEVDLSAHQVKGKKNENEHDWDGDFTFTINF